MGKQVQDAYIVAATRTPVGKAPRGVLKHARPDDMLAHVLKSALAQAPGLDPSVIDDFVVGCAMPEAEQGMNVARIGLLLAGFPNTVSGVTLNRFCSSGLQAVATAADRIRLGEADVMIGAGTESMSMIPMGGNKIVANEQFFTKDENIGIATAWASPPRKWPSNGRSAGKRRMNSRPSRIGAHWLRSRKASSSRK